MARKVRCFGHAIVQDRWPGCIWNVWTSGGKRLLTLSRSIVATSVILITGLVEHSHLTQGSTSLPWSGCWRAGWQNS